MRHKKSIVQVIFEDPTLAIGEVNSDFPCREYVVYGVLEKKGNYCYINCVGALDSFKGDKKAIFKVPKGCVKNIKYLKEDKCLK